MTTEIKKHLRLSMLSAGNKMNDELPFAVIERSRSIPNGIKKINL